MIVAIGLGSNLGDSVANVEHAIALLAGLGKVTSRSRLYRSTPWGEEQPEFINAVALLETTLEPRALLGELKELELRLGRVPTYRWGPRRIDLDILIYGELIVHEDDLVIPHPRLFERAFALGPLAEVDSRFSAAYERLPADERARIGVLGRAPSGSSGG